MEESSASSSNRRLDLLYGTLKKAKSSESVAAVVDDALDPLACETDRTRTSDTKIRHKNVTRNGWKTIANISVSSFEKHSLSHVVMYSIEVSLARDNLSKKSNNASMKGSERPYSVWRRYNHFCNTFTYLVSSNHSVPDFFKQLFPQKRFIWGHLVTDEELRQRQEELELWLRAVVNYANENMSPSSMYGVFHATLRLEIQAFLSPATSNPTSISNGNDLARFTPPSSPLGGDNNYNADLGIRVTSGVSKMRAKNGIGFINAVDRSGEISNLPMRTAIDDNSARSSHMNITRGVGGDAWGSGSLTKLLSKTLNENSVVRKASRVTSDERNGLIDNHFTMSATSPTTETKHDSTSSKRSSSNKDSSNKAGAADDLFGEVDSPLLYRTLSLIARIPLIQGLLDNDSDVHGAHEDDDRDKYLGM